MHQFKIFSDIIKNDEWIENGWTVVVMTMIILVILMNTIYFVKSCCGCCRGCCRRCCCNQRSNNEIQSNGGYKSSAGYRTIVWDNSDYDENDYYDSNDDQMEDKQFMHNDNSIVVI